MSATMASVLTRLAAATSIIRTRQEDRSRTKHNGGSAADLQARVEDAVVEFEKAAKRLSRIAETLD